MRFYRITALTLVGCLALLGCKKKEEPPPPAEISIAPVPTTVETTPVNVPFKVSSIDLGKGIGADKKVTDTTTTFGPKDTIYAVVSTDGTTPTAKVKARWTYGAKNKLVSENEVTITPTGPTSTELQISQPKGLPTGPYKVEIFTDGTSAGTKDFEVKK